MKAFLFREGDGRGVHHKGTFCRKSAGFIDFQYLDCPPMRGYFISLGRILSFEQNFHLPEEF